MPGRPAAPKRLPIALGGFVAGLLLSLVIVAGLELFFPTMVRPEAIERSFASRHLATLPEIGAVARPAAAPAPLGSLRAIRHILIEPQSDFAEEVRSLRVGIEAAGRGLGPQIVLVASAMPGEGKSLIAANLAHHYALSGVKTLLVDADLRRAALTRVFMPGAGRGLIDSLIDRTPVREAVVRETVSGLHFLPASAEGGSAAAAAELLASPAMAESMEELRAEFPLVVVDCPPVMPVVDARILADLVDQIVFVFNWQRTPRPLARRALKHLSGRHGRVTGIVVNEVPADQLETDRTFAYAPVPSRRAG